jgi:hypothetical protein
MRAEGAGRSFARPPRPWLPGKDEPVDLRVAQCCWSVRRASTLDRAVVAEQITHPVGLGDHHR